MAASRESRPTPPATLAVVRLAILLGALAFGGVAWYVRRQPDWTASPAVNDDAFFFATLGIWATATVGLMILRTRWQRETDPARRTPLMITGWALGEIPALWGGVLYLLGADPQRYLTGLLFLVMAFLLLPLRPARPRG